MSVKKAAPVVGLLVKPLNLIVLLVGGWEGGVVLCLLVGHISSVRIKDSYGDF